MQLTTTDLWQTAVLLVLLFLSGFFSSAETALMTVNRIRIENRAEGGDERAKRLLGVLDQRDKMLSAVLIGNNIVNLSASALMTTVVIRIFGNYAVGAATGILTLLVLVFGEVVPKSRAMIRSEEIALKDVGAIRFVMTVLTPVIFLINGIARLVLRLMGVDPDAKPEAMTEDELLSIVDVSHKDGVIEKEEREMINNVVDFGDTEAIDIMIPWVDVTSAEIDDTYDELIQIFEEHRFTRLPVYEGSQDNIVGILNMKDLLLVDREEFNLENVLREPYFAFEHKKLTALLEEMRENSLSIVIVIDEYGATSGIITMENVLEEIVGDIQDEYKGRDAEEITTLHEGKEYSCLGSVSLDDLNEVTGLSLSSEEYETIGGYLIEHSEDDLPEAGEYIVTDKATFVVEAVKKNRITRVHIYINEENGFV